ncbi:MAG: hypothetical protein Q8N04_05890 [Nitrospira sp.]|nr:hypothetical protein [Nitrospira sp.]
MIRSFSRQALYISLLLGPVMSLGIVSSAFAQAKAEKSFTAAVTDAQGIESEIKNVIFYWEEKVSETAFVPHELRHVPVKKGTATVNVKFDAIKQIEVKAGPEKGLPSLTITLTNGKSGDFGLAIDGKFKGESDFGEVELPAAGLKKIVFK